MTPTKPIIEIKGIGKKYDITHQQGGYVALRDVITNVFKNPFSFLKSKAKQAIGLEKKEEFWALKNVSFDVMKGEVIGIIGKNGSGKSTLLKVLSGITPPTEGEIVMRGRVASLLEVGTGFHPELTGRENIFLNGAILGMTRKEIAKKFDAIVTFSGVEKFLDTPIKHYSSGMQVRLAFSVAAHMEPDILIIDEVLAVGDAEFQKKCLGKMEEVTQKEGRTILFVSHDMAAVRTLCKKCVLLDTGKIIANDDTNEVLDIYLQKQTAINSGTRNLSDPSLRKNSNENSLFKFDRISLINSEHKSSGLLRLSEPFTIELEGHYQGELKNFFLAFDIRSSLGIHMFNSIVEYEKIRTTHKNGRKKIGIAFDTNYLPPGSYTMGISALGDDIVEWIPDALTFSVEPVSKDFLRLHDKFDGVMVHPHTWIEIE